MFLARRARLGAALRGPLCAPGPRVLRATGLTSTSAAYAARNRQSFSQMPLSRWKPPTKSGKQKGIGSVPRLSRMMVPTLKAVKGKDAADGVSLKMSLRAGLIRMLGSGLYLTLPLGQRVLDKITRIVDEELQQIGCQRLDMPLLMSKGLWKQTGRWDSTGKELFRLKDRKGHDFCMGPTHEEAFTTLVANESLGMQDLPLKLYQVGKKFRDELRPRQGQLRAKEFVMKDLYTFHATEDDAFNTYSEVSEAYSRIFERVGLDIIRVEADSGNIGGSRSHEYHVSAQVGEDVLIKCSTCSYAANVEKATGDCTALGAAASNALPPSALDCHDPRNDKDWDPVSTAMQLRDIAPAQVRSGLPYTCNAVVLDGRTEDAVFVFLRRDRELNPIAVKSFLGCSEVRVCKAGEAGRLLRRFHASGLWQSARRPNAHVVVPLDGDVDEDAFSQEEIDSDMAAGILEGGEVLVDTSLLPQDRDIDVEAAHGGEEGEWTQFEGPEWRKMKGDFGRSGGQSGIQYVGEAEGTGSAAEREAARARGEVHIDDETPAEQGRPLDDMGSGIRACSQGVFRLTQAKDRCSFDNCSGLLQETNGIELGHVFHLGTKYSKPMKCEFKGRDGVKHPMQMGCYGLGVTRTMAAVVETKSDDKGIVWPEAIAPYRVCVLPIGDQTSVNVQAANSICRMLNSTDLEGDFVLDDRLDKSPGFRLKDAELVGYPWLVVVGKSYAENETVELQRRGQPKATRTMTLKELSDFFKQ